MSSSGSETVTESEQMSPSPKKFGLDKVPELELEEIEPELDFYSLQDRYAFFTKIKLHQCETRFAANSFYHFLAVNITELAETWLASWDYELYDEYTDEIQERKCIVRVDRVGDDLECECTFVDSWSLVQPEDINESVMKNQKTREYLTEKTIGLDLLTPLLYNGGSVEAVEAERANLVIIANLIDNLRFAEKVLFREWDVWVNNEIIDTTKNFYSEFVNRLFLYQYLWDGTISENMVKKYHQRWMDYQDINEQYFDMLKSRNEVLESNNYDDVENFNRIVEDLTLEKVRHAEILNFWENLNFDHTAKFYRKERKPLIESELQLALQKLRIVSESGVATLENIQEALSGSQDMAIAMHSNFEDALLSSQQADIIRVLPGIYEFPDVNISHDLIVSGVLESKTDSPTDSYDIKLIGLQALVSSACFFVLENVQMTESIKIISGNVTLKNCVISGDDIKLTTMSNSSSLTLIDCTIYTNNLELIRFPGSNLTLEGCSIFTENGTFVPQLDEEDPEVQMENCQFGIEEEQVLVEERIDDVDLSILDDSIEETEKVVECDVPAEGPVTKDTPRVVEDSDVREENGAGEHPMLMRKRASLDLTKEQIEQMQSELKNVITEPVDCTETAVV